MVELGCVHVGGTVLWNRLQRYLVVYKNAPKLEILSKYVGYILVEVFEESIYGAA